ncbi:MAG: Lsr2 family protein [Bifidobacteriaceae bacterium]|jgi:hypothetical protein|nr:Lsr2 family protein [Bifidobacteriaceae bacterium]
MAKRVVLELLDDLDQTPATQSVVFGLDGRLFTIDLNDQHAGELRAFLETYTAAGRKVTGRRAGVGARRTETEDVDLAAVRAWAASNGIPVPKRGRVSNDIIAKYKAAGY